MKLSKNEAKKLAQTAKSIVNEESHGTYDGGTYTKETTLTYNQMLQSLKETSRWWANQYDNTIFISSHLHNITVTL